MSTSEITITLTAVDNASSVIDEFSSNVEDADTQIADSTQQVSNATQETSVSTTQQAMAFNGLAMSGMMLYQGINNIENAQVSLDRAHVTVERDTDAVASAQLGYDDAVAAYGPNSIQAVDAAAKLKTAQDALTVAQERLGVAQRNYDSTILYSAMQIIPSLVMAFTSIVTIAPSVSSGIEMMSGALDFLAANPIVLVIAGVAALVLGLIYAYNNCAPFRDAINDIGAALGGAILAAAKALTEAFTFLWEDVILPLGKLIAGEYLTEWDALSAALNFLWNNVLKPLGEFLEDVFLKAINDVTSAIKPFQTAVSDVSSVAGDLTKGISDIGGALSHLCFVHAAPAAAEFNKTISESIGLTDTLTGKVSSLSSSLMGVSGGIGAGTVGSIAASAAASKGPTINISAPLVQIQGSADKATAQMAAKLVQDGLKNIIVEPSSHAAATTHKRILVGRNNGVG